MVLLLATYNSNLDKISSSNGPATTKFGSTNIPSQHRIKPEYTIFTVGNNRGSLDQQIYTGIGEIDHAEVKTVS